jgi:hypothetical protein
MLSLGERRLQSVLAEYARHSNGRRPHRGRQLRPPRPGHRIADFAQERIKRRAVLGGLINEYERAAIKDQVKGRGRILEPHKFRLGCWSRAYPAARTRDLHRAGVGRASQVAIPASARRSYRQSMLTRTWPGSSGQLAVLPDQSSFVQVRIARWVQRRVP